jgi:hypothetical protein
VIGGVAHGVAVMASREQRIEDKAARFGAVMARQ